MSRKSRKLKKANKTQPLKQAQKYLEPRDTGSAFSTLRRGELVGLQDHALAENPASILYAKGIIDQTQHKAAHLFGAFHERVWGRPDGCVGRYDALVAGELLELVAEGDERDEAFRRAYEAAKTVLERCGRVANDITMTVCIYGVLPSQVLRKTVQQEQLLKGLEALAGYLIGRTREAA